MRLYTAQQTPMTHGYMYVFAIECVTAIRSRRHADYCRTQTACSQYYSRQKMSIIVHFFTCIIKLRYCFIRVAVHSEGAIHDEKNGLAYCQVQVDLFIMY